MTTSPPLRELIDMRPRRSGTIAVAVEGSPGTETLTMLVPGQTVPACQAANQPDGPTAVNDTTAASAVWGTPTGVTSTSRVSPGASAEPVVRVSSRRLGPVTISRPSTDVAAG